jgi:hypothetical protein
VPFAINHGILRDASRVPILRKPGAAEASRVPLCVKGRRARRASFVQSEFAPDRQFCRIFFAEYYLRGV